MSSPARPVPTLPADTFHRARKVYNIENIYLTIGDQLEPLLDSISQNQPNLPASLPSNANFQLSLVTAFQYAESLTDMQASEAVLKRMDWKYALHLPVNHPGISPSVFCEFRQYLSCQDEGLDEYDRLLDRLGKTGLFSKKALRTLTSWEVLRTVCRVNRIDRLHQAVKTAFAVLVTTQPDWLRANIQPYWYERFRTGQLGQLFSMDESQYIEAANQLGSDICQLLKALRKEDIPGMFSLPEIQNLAHLFEDQFQHNGEMIQLRLPSCASGNCYRSKRGTR